MLQKGRMHPTLIYLHEMNMQHHSEMVMVQKKKEGDIVLIPTCPYTERCLDGGHRNILEKLSPFPYA